MSIRRASPAQAAEARAAIRALAVALARQEARRDHEAEKRCGTRDPESLDAPLRRES